jgi:hypothetical protein
MRRLLQTTILVVTKWMCTAETSTQLKGEKIPIENSARSYVRRLVTIKYEFYKAQFLISTFLLSFN